MLIADVDPRSPAEEAGMKRGLVIYQVGRFEVTGVKQVEELLAPIAAGSQVDFTVGVIRRVGGRNVRQLQPVALLAR